MRSVTAELGHACSMTVAPLVPLLLYFLYRTALQAGTAAVKITPTESQSRFGAYAPLPSRAEYIVLWFSRCRGYYADRFAGRVTGNPRRGGLGTGEGRPTGWPRAGESPPRMPKTEGTGKKKGKKRGSPSLSARSARWGFSTVNPPWPWLPARRRPVSSRLACPHKRRRPPQSARKTLRVRCNGICGTRGPRC